MNSFTLPQILSWPFHQTPSRQNLRPHRSPTAVPAKTSSFSDDDDDVKTLAQFTSNHNHIRVLEVSRRAVGHPFAGSRLLLLDSPGNIHSVSFLFHPFTFAYFDVFATFPPILPSGPVAVLGFGAGTAARLLFNLYPGSITVHGWELDPAVVSVAREFFGLGDLEKLAGNKLFVHIGNALEAEIDGGFAGIFVDLFSKGKLIPELQERETWVRLKNKLRKGGRAMVNCGGSCVEAEDGGNGEMAMRETLKVMSEVFEDEVFVIMLKEEDSCVAFTGPGLDFAEWKGKLVKELRGHVDLWNAYNG